MTTQVSEHIISSSSYIMNNVPTNIGLRYIRNQFPLVDSDVLETIIGKHHFTYLLMIRFMWISYFFRKMMYQMKMT